MIFQGTFNDYNNSYKYKVTIATPVGNTTIPIIDPTEAPPSGDDRIYFSPDPVHLTCERSDLTQLIVITQCQIKLKVNNDLSHILFADTDRDISVLIEREIITHHTDFVNGQIVHEYTTSYRKIFFGYVDPLQFNQPFAHNVDEIVINATDPLGSLERLNITQIEAERSDTIPMINMITKIMDAIFPLNSADSSGWKPFSGIRTYFNTNIKPNLVKINNSVFWGNGENEDDWMNLYDVLYEILKYLGCTIYYEPEGGTVNLYNLYQGTAETPKRQNWFDAKEDAMNDSSSLSKDDAYNKVSLTCEIEPKDDDIKLLDDEFMFSDYSNYQKYMTELVSAGNGDSAFNGFKDLMTKEETEYDGGYFLDHYCYVKRNSAWSFGNDSYITAMNGTENKEATTEQQRMKGDQSDVLRWLKTHTGKAAFVSFGKGNKINIKDNSPVNNIPLTDYLVISVNGHNDHGENGHIRIIEEDLKRNNPICKYTGLESLNLIPTDKNITNYIIISGKVILNPLQRKTGPNWEADPNFPEDWHDGPGGMEMLYNNSTNTFNDVVSVLNDNKNISLGVMPMLWHHTVPHPDNGDGAYYQQKWWKCSDPREPVYTFDNTVGTYGYLDNKENEMLAYTYSTFKDDDTINQVDKVSKLPLLACQLKVGDYYCVERLDLGEKGAGVFEWMTYDDFMFYCSSVGFNIPYFTIGIDPKVDDKIVGHSYSIQNNIKYTMNIDASGTAIPIKITDKLNGVPEFSIIGILNQQWDEVERVHPTMFRHTSYNHHKFWTLELLDSILISDLKIEFKSDNALYNQDMTTADNDLVYVSAENPTYSDTLECDLKICTPLTLEQCQEKGIKYQISNSYVMTETDEPFYGWRVGNSLVRNIPEHMFIDYFYTQYSKPATKIDMCIDNGDIFGSPNQNDTSFVSFSSIVAQYLINLEYPGIYDYTLPYVDNMPQKKVGNYFCMSMNWSIKYRENSMTVREMFDYANPF